MAGLVSRRNLPAPTMPAKGPGVLNAKTNVCLSMSKVRSRNGDHLKLLLVTPALSKLDTLASEVLRLPKESNRELRREEDRAFSKSSGVFVSYLATAGS